MLNKTEKKAEIYSLTEWDAVLKQKLAKAKLGAPLMLGFPTSTNLDEKSSPHVAELLNYHTQQGPDPDFIPPFMPYAAEFRELERRVVRIAADLFKGDEHCWGYVASGGHESNRIALLTAREKFKKQGILYFSKGAHYGIPSLAFELDMPNKIIGINKDGSINIDELIATIDKTKPVILVLTLGTTMNGVIDDVKSVTKRLEQAGIKDFYLHCDAALHGNYLPFMQETADINFAKLPIHSLAISPYKAWGSPIPNSIFLSNETLLAKQDAQYVMIKKDQLRHLPTSSRGSLGVIYAMERWVHIGGIDGMRKETARRMELTQYAVEQIKTKGFDAAANPNSTIITIKDFPMNPALIVKWQLKLEDNMPSIVISGHVTKETIDNFVADLALTKTSSLQNSLK